MLGAEGTAVVAGRRRVPPVAAECLVYFAFGMPIAMLGVAWPQLRDVFGRPDSALGVLAVAYGFGRLLTSGSSNRVLRRLHFGHAVVVGASGLGAASGLVAVARSWPVLVGAIFLIGLLSGVLDSLGARFLAVHGQVSSAGLITGSYGVGATVGPALVAITGRWALSYGVAAAVGVGVAVLLAVLPIAWPAAVDHPDRGTVVGTDRPPTDSAAAVRLDRSALIRSLALFFLFIAVEVTAGQWMASMLEDARHVGHRLAGLSVSAFWAGITIGRLLLARLRLTDRLLLAGSLVVAAAFGLTAVAPRNAVLPLLLVAGLCLSPVAPTLFARTADRVGVAMAPAVSGWQLIAANVSGIGVPALTGVLVGAVSPFAPAAVLVVVAGGGAGLLALEHRRRGSPDASPVDPG